MIDQFILISDECETFVNELLKNLAELALKSRAEHIELQCQNSLFENVTAIDNGPPALFFSASCRELGEIALSKLSTIKEYISNVRTIEKRIARLERLEKQITAKADEVFASDPGMFEDIAESILDLIDTYSDQIGNLTSPSDIMDMVVNIDSQLVESFAKFVSEIASDGVDEYYSKSGNALGFQRTISHQKLGERKTLKAKEEDELDLKVQSELQKWLKKWEKLELSEKKKTNVLVAEERTNRASANLDAIDKILSTTLNVHDALDWSSLCLPAADPPFPKPKKPTLKEEAKPLQSDFPAKIPVWARILGRSQKYKLQASDAYKSAVGKWQNKQSQHAKEFDELNNAYTLAMKLIDALHDNKKESSERQNLCVDDLRTKYFEGNNRAIEKYCALVLSKSEYPDWMQKDFQLAYNSENRTLVVEYELPEITALPNTASIKYVAARNAFETKDVPKGRMSANYDSLLYQIALRTLHEMFEADIPNYLDAVAFNGVLTAPDAATGKLTTKCILSIQAEKLPFEELVLSNIDPKACFKALKGLSAPTLTTKTPVAPIVDLDRNDKRFVKHYDVSGQIDSETNLASMDWEDFEHLVRELFEMEFAVGGGEVRVTQASSDGGVDAIAFDPDPIRGGKIVIQAKRYTNIVGVAAVRDLYGTIMNEGATKGILVTTSDFGPDSFTFAKDKPISLLNGNNLLSLLEKHGKKASINIEAARAAFKSSQ